MNWKNGLSRLSILTRGAIARGSTYHKKRIIFGEGLNRAYELERRAAVYPRIIVTDEVRQQLEEAGAEIPINISFLSMVVRDYDGLWLIDPFARPRSWEAYRDGEDCRKKAVEGLERLRSQIFTGLWRVQTDQPTKLDRIAKHRWLNASIWPWKPSVTRPVFLPSAYNDPQSKATISPVL
ncbi:MAG TPA: hypothetical protein VJU77_00710 [Chthoniobacterales bacterium]|nr:hypothetical protein [Chthoniobacterales bacterium]